ncbi:MAG: hypothetical protein KIT44_09380 [Opitutaceae bacterium]|nr:hypothetical protein [Opitutaceae bacterium]
MRMWLIFDSARNVFTLEADHASQAIARFRKDHRRHPHEILGVLMGAHEVGTQVSALPKPVFGMVLWVANDPNQKPAATPAA